jgi:hypothetical protein
LAEAELAAVCDADPKVRERVARQYPATLVTGDLAALLGAVDAVIVASPAATHATIAQQAVEAGKPVLVEKPLRSMLGCRGSGPARCRRKVAVLAFCWSTTRRGDLWGARENGEKILFIRAAGQPGAGRKDENALWSFGRMTCRGTLLAW